MITEDQKYEIVKLWNSGEMNLIELAIRYGVSRQRIFVLTRGGRVGHIQSTYHKQNRLKLFHSSYIKLPSGCWYWIKDTVEDYGHFKIDNSGLAHRSSWILHYGNIPIDKQVLHKCDNRRCVNPEHLYLGDNLDNAIDRKAIRYKTGELWLIERLVNRFKTGPRVYGLNIPNICKMFKISIMTLHRMRKSSYWPCIDGVYQFDWKI